MAFWAWTAAAAALAADGPAPDAVPMPTLGGKQFWADELFFHQWRIQRNSWDDHCRLLDENDFRHASGTFEECRSVLEQIKIQRHLPPMRGKAVLLLHGLSHSRAAMEPMAQYLRKEGGYVVFNVSYPSTQRDIGQHAQSLKHIIENLDGIEEINFVAHSMGNIVVRHYLGDETDARTARRPDRRIKRFVMLAPPNHRNVLAVMAADNGLFRLATGEAGQQLGRGWQDIEPRLATPAFEFAIIAGGRGDDKGYNPLIPGDNDGTVSVASTRLGGAADFMVLPVLHPFIMFDAKVQHCTLRFLEHGYLMSPDEQRPIGR
jgi:pimeloyl-ACP methyl ester carboxylesterase